jgi:hypothetical protein
MRCVTVTPRWFSGAASADERDNRFILAVAAAALNWTTDLSPHDTSTRPATDEGAGAGRLVEIRLPQLTTPCRILRVLYDLDVAGRPTLQSEWTASPKPFEHLYELPDEETDLWVQGVEAAPEQCGDWAAAWFERQLRRPVLRREWDRPRSGVSTLIPGSFDAPALVEWTALQPDQSLDTQGGLPWDWLKYRPPSREILERSPAPE